MGLARLASPLRYNNCVKDMIEVLRRDVLVEVEDLSEEAVNTPRIKNLNRG